MRLRTINEFLRPVGLVLVVETGSEGVRLWIERVSTYAARCRRKG